MFDLQKLKRAADRNLSIYDTDAAPGEFTLRHLALMRLCGRRYFRYPEENFTPITRLSKIWLPKEVYDIIQDRDLELDEPHDNIYGEDAGYFPPEAELVLEELKKTYLQIYGDKHICVAEYDNGEYLLGSF